MNIVHVLFRLLTGGTELMLVDIANSQVEAGNCVSVIIINDGYDNDLLKRFDDKVNIILLNRKQSSKNPMWLYRINSVLWKLHPDVVHCHDQKALGMIVKRKNVLYVFTVHCIGEQIRESRKADLFCAISEAVRSDVKEREGIDSVVVLNGFKSHSIRKKVENNYHNPFKIVCVSRLCHETKGQHLLINALSGLPFDATLTLIGGGESEQYLRSLTKELGIEDKVTFLGNLSRDYIYDNLHDYDLLVQPSLTEGFGLTIAEGLAAGLPVLVSNLEGPLQVIDNGTYGYIFDVGDSADLRSKIIEIRDNYDSAIKKNRDSAAYIYDNFDIVTTIGKYGKVYEKYLSSQTN